MITETIGLQLEADTRAWDAAFSAAEKSASQLGGEVGKVTSKLAEAEKKVASFGSALSSTGTKGFAAFGGLLRQQQESIKALEALGRQQEGIWSKVTKKVIEAEVVIGGLKRAWQAVGDYMDGAFARAKIDPALAGINQMREATEEWTRTWHSAVDGVLNRIAEGLYGDPTRTKQGAVSLSARESALRELADKGYPVNIPGFETSPEYRDAYGRYFNQYSRRAGIDAGSQVERARLQAVLATTATLPATLAAQQARAGGGIAGVAALTGGAFQGQDVAGWGDAGGRSSGRGRGRGAPLDLTSWLNRPGQQSASSFFDVEEEQTTSGGVFGRLGGLGRRLGGMDPLKQISELKKALSDAALQGRLQEIQDETTAIGGALATLTGGLTAAVDAAIAGNESIGRAFLKGSAQVLKGIALKATGLAAFEGAMAWVEPLESARHLTAAGKLLAAAAISGTLAAGAGGLAGAIGGGGGRGSSAATGGYSSRPSSGPAAQGGNTYNVNINGFYGDERQAIPAIHRGLEKAEQSRRVRPSSSRVVRYGAAA